MSNSNSIFDFLYAWINQIINVEGGASIPIIEANTNNPAPAIPYIVIEDPGNRKGIGMAYQLEQDENDIKKFISDKTFIVEIREIGGKGDRLETLIESIARPSIIQLFTAAGLAYMDEGSILPIPRLNGDKWVKEAIVEITLGYATSIEEDVGSIETIEFQANLGGTQE